MLLTFTQEEGKTNTSISKVPCTEMIQEESDESSSDLMDGKLLIQTQDLVSNTIHSINTLLTSNAAVSKRIF